MSRRVVGFWGTLEIFGTGFSQTVFSAAERYQIQMAVERIRPSEIFFEPHLCGKDSAGLMECLENVLSWYPASVREEMCANVHVTGGATLSARFPERIENELRSRRPVDSKVHVQAISDHLDAWRGARLFSMRPESKDAWLTAQEFSQFGGLESPGKGGFHEHLCSNTYISAETILASAAGPSNVSSAGNS